MTVVSTLQISQGPVFNCESLLKPKLLGLSKISSGTVLSLSPKKGIYYFGEYKVVLIQAPKGYGFWPSVKLALYALIEAYRIRRKKKLDIVISYDPLKTGLLACMIKFVFGAKFICEINGVYDSEVLYDFRKGLSLRVKKYIYPRVQKLVMMYADAIKCLYPNQVKGFDLKEDKKEFCFFDYTNIDVGSYLVNTVPTLLSVGFPAYIKGFDILINAFNQVKTDFPAWQLVIVGHFSSAEILELQRLASGDGRVKILRPVPFGEIPALLDSADIFVLPSRTEAMGRVLIEAMARGRARVASNVDGIPTVLDHQKDGLLFEKNNAIELEHALRKLMSSEALRKRLAEAGLQRYMVDFTIEQYVQHTEKMFESVIKN